MSVSVVISPAKNPKKKYTAVFSKDGKKIKTTHFGSGGMSDFTIHGKIKRGNRDI